ncbi:MULTISPECIES: LysR substrate-binding domain-containing protein [Polaromonas]|uniref:LysR substrate-binding domain-containing protein n=1 Tax=Polaromonas aquatica TaxID=332657 RepID=A0ABW1TU92_9BURK
MDLRRLEYFVAVAEAGSFSKAAAVLVMSQPALSQQVAALEQETGQRLLNRTGRGAEPTEAGLALLAHARAIFELAERARADMRERQLIPSGRITIGLPPRVAHAMTADLVERFRAEFPDAAISVEEGLSIRLREWLVAGRLDVAVLFDPPASPLLSIETVARESLVLMASTPLPSRIRLAEVAALPLVLPSKPNSLRQLLESEARPRGYLLKVVAEVDSIKTVLSLVARGVAATVLPASAIREWTHSTPPFMAAIHAPVIRNRLCIAVPKARPATRLSRSLVQLTRELCVQYYGDAVRVRKP